MSKGHLIRLATCLLAIGGSCLFLWPRSARADSLAGQSGVVQYDYPTLGTLYSLNGGPVSFTVPGTVDLDFTPPVVLNAITGSGIDINLLPNTFGATSFNGEVFTFPSFTITGVSVSQDLTATVTFDAHDVYVNFEGLSFSTESYVDITVNGSSGAVPEPSSVFLLGAGLLGLGPLIRRRVA